MKMLFWAVYSCKARNEKNYVKLFNCLFTLSMVMWEMQCKMKKPIIVAITRMCAMLLFEFTF